MKFVISICHGYGHIGNTQKPGAGIQSPSFSKDSQGIMYATIGSFAHHQAALINPVMLDWYMSTQK